MQPKPMPMILDDPRELSRADPSDMLGTVLRLGPMVAEGWELASGVAVPAGRPDSVVVIGMGGSAIGGDLLRALLWPAAPVPVITVRDERLPGFVGTRTLVFLCSYSGNTEETLAAYNAVCAAGAPAVAITSGGRLAGRARRQGHPVIDVLPGLQPRAALPLLLMPMLRVASELGIDGSTEAEIRQTARLLIDLAHEWGPDVPAASNPAKRLARVLLDGRPAIYAASPFVEPVARRWKTQLNENAKVQASFDVFPELLHNEVVGWEQAGGTTPRPHVVLLRDAEESSRNALRVELAREIAFGPAPTITEVWAQGTSRLARLFSLILFGDLVSVYMAILSGVDPTPVEPITRIKTRLQPD